MLPFIIWFRIKNIKSLPSRDINLYIEEFFSSPQANWLVFFWAAGEAVIWFVIPEFLLLLVIFMRVHKKRQMLIFDIAGTVVGTLVAISLRLSDSAIANLPYIQEKMVSQTRIWYENMGLMGLVNQPFSGVPYKVFTNLYWQYDFFIIYFIVLAILVRIIRYLFAYGIFISLYPKLHKIVEKNYIYLALTAILIFSILLYNTYKIYS